MKFGWRGWLGVAVSAAALWYTLRGIDLGEVWNVLERSNWMLLVGSALVATLVFPLRALRWRVILEPVVDIPFGPLFRATTIGMMVNNVAPARAGEVARAFAVTREVRALPFSTAVASLAVDRIIDAVIIVILLVVSILASDIPTDTTIGTWSVARMTQVAGGIALVALVGVVVLAFRPSLATSVFDATVGRLAPRLHEKTRPLVDSLLSGFSSLRSPQRFAKIMGWGMAMWLVNALAFHIAFIAVGIDVPFAAAVFVQSLVALGVAAPSTPGFIGVFEFVATKSLAFYQVPADLAFSWGLGFHFVSFIPVTVIGLWYFSRLGMRFGELGREPA